MSENSDSDLNDPSPKTGASCGKGCGCSSPCGSSSRWGWIILAVVLILGALIVRYFKMGAEPAVSVSEPQPIHE